MVRGTRSTAPVDACGDARWAAHLQGQGRAMSNAQSDYTLKSLDDACEALRKMIRRDGLTRITIDIGADGRVDIYAARGLNTAWVAHGDTLPGGALEYPSAAVCDAAGAPTDVQRDAKRGSNAE